MPFVQNPIPTYSEASMLAMLPSVGNLYFFYNSDKNNDLYSVDSLGTFTFVKSADAEDDDCCGCELSSQWLCALNEALNRGAMTADKYNTAIASGFYVNSTNDHAGNCTLYIGTNFPRLMAIAIAPRPTTLAIAAHVQLAIVATPTGANPNVIWVSSNTDRATVSTSGYVTGTGAGSVTITAYSVTDGSISDSITITVS